MPRGSIHHIEGMLLRERGALVLRCDDGDQWRLRADPDAYRLTGCRVRLQGVRIGFDLLDVGSLQRSAPIGCSQMPSRSETPIRHRSLRPKGLSGLLTALLVAALLSGMLGLLS